MRSFLPRPLLSPRDRPWLHVALFVATLVSTTFAGGVWAGRDLLYARDLWFTWAGMGVGPTFLADGLRFSVPLLLFLTAHEFGHYVAARHHRMDASLPYYLPFPVPAPYLLSFGTFGAVIQLRSPLPTSRVLFDVGAAGPLAGLVVALAGLAFALATLPDPTYLQDVSGHEFVNAQIATTGVFPEAVPPGERPLTLVPPALIALTSWFADTPPGYELYHYPTLLASWLGLFFTALNLLPVGQLDGGHIVYAQFGRRVHGIVARVVLLLMLGSGTLGALAVLDGAPDWLPFMLTGYGVPRVAALAASPWLAGLLYLLVGVYVMRLLQRVFGGVRGALAAVAVFAVGLALVRVLPGAVEYGWLGWLLWGLLVVRAIGVDHPPVAIEEPLTPGRQLLGWVCIATFALCFAPIPIR